MLTAAHEMNGSNRSSFAVDSKSASWKKHTRDVTGTGELPVFTSVDVAVRIAVYGLPAGAASTLIATRCSSPDGPEARPSELLISFASRGPVTDPLEHATAAAAEINEIARRTIPSGTASLLDIWGFLPLNPESQ